MRGTLVGLKGNAGWTSPREEERKRKGIERRRQLGSGPASKRRGEEWNIGPRLGLSPQERKKRKKKRERERERQAGPWNGEEERKREMGREREKGEGKWTLLLGRFFFFFSHSIACYDPIQF